MRGTMARKYSQQLAARRQTSSSSARSMRAQWRFVLPFAPRLLRIRRALDFRTPRRLLMRL